jgi:metal transporter CNNM
MVLLFCNQRRLFICLSQVRIRSGDAAGQRFAKRIYALRRRGNWLLCTLILGNTAANALLAIIMADLTSGFDHVF